MMPREKNGVVNPELVVYGTKNVRVADLSIIPIHVASHTQCEYLPSFLSGDILIMFILPSNCVCYRRKRWVCRLLSFPVIDVFYTVSDIILGH
jgi:GMC oxidoreductase